MPSPPNYSTKEIDLLLKCLADGMNTRNITTLLPGRTHGGIRAFMSKRGISARKIRNAATKSQVNHVTNDTSMEENMDGLCDYIKAGSKTFLRATCESCGGHEEIPVEDVSTANSAAANTLNARYWWARKLDDGRWRSDCPTCSKSIREKEMKAKETAHTTIQKQSNQIPLKKQIEIIGLLSAHFDGDAGRFLNGYSDAKIAEETGISESAIASLRVEGFGSLKDDELVRFRDELNAFNDLLKSTSESLRGELQELFRKWAKLEQQRAR